MKLQVDETGMMARPVNPYAEQRTTIGGLLNYDQFDLANPKRPLTQPCEANSIIEGDEVWQIENTKSKWSTLTYAEYEVYKGSNAVTRQAYQPFHQSKPLSESEGEKEVDGWIRVDIDSENVPHDFNLQYLWGPDFEDTQIGHLEKYGNDYLNSEWRIENKTYSFDQITHFKNFILPTPPKTK